MKRESISRLVMKRLEFSSCHMKTQMWVYQLLTSCLWNLAKPYKTQNVNQHDKVYHMFSYQRCQVDI